MSKRSCTIDVDPGLGERHVCRCGPEAPAAESRDVDNILARASNSASIAVVKGMGCKGARNRAGIDVIAESGAVHSTERRLEMG